MTLREKGEEVGGDSQSLHVQWAYPARKQLSQVLPTCPDLSRKRPVPYHESELFQGRTATGTCLAALTRGPWKALWNEPSKTSVRSPSNGRSCSPGTWPLTGLGRIRLLSTWICTTRCCNLSRPFPQNIWGEGCVGCMAAKAELPLHFAGCRVWQTWFKGISERNSFEEIHVCNSYIRLFGLMRGDEVDRKVVESVVSVGPRFQPEVIVRTFQISYAASLEACSS